ncbi:MULTISPECIES: HdeD family acid-resistance protein [unclassified Aureimonas]|uniref:HdeD family acid-resistance protein n=1 Tax=unclassified Aureimonas TaxID=2615206 RepID=UPI0007213F27|nr:MULTISPECIES: DUF308 domain-containing protein [unclassified Aureimonas]ALN71123.1 hypothetical protein M673_00280 [Aureimonas sp. AU20]
MSFDNDPPVDPVTMRREMRRYLHAHWRAFSLQGLLMALAGGAALLAPLLATLVSTFFFGWMLILLGFAGLIACFRMRGATGFWSNLAFTVLTLLLGGIILFDPFTGAVTLTTALAVYFLLVGLATFPLAMAFRESTGRFVLLVLSALVNVALALFLVIGLPGTAVWAVGTFLGISLLISGVSLLLAALDARKGPKGGAGRR